MSTYKIKKGRYYISPQDGKVEEIYPQDIKLDGISYKLHKDLYKELDNKYIQLQNTLETSIYAIREFLSKNGINTPNDDLKSLINDLYTLKVINNDNEYSEINYNDRGYVYSVNLLSGDIDSLNCAIPYDIDNQCYKLVDGVFILDKEEKEKRGVII